MNSEKFDKAIEHFKQELSGLRTGRASAALDQWTLGDMGTVEADEDRPVRFALVPRAQTRQEPGGTYVTPWWRLRRCH